MSQLIIGRLSVGPPTQWHEQMGDPITNLGGAAVPQVRSALRHAISVATFAPDGATDTVTARLVLRRALRSMLNNTPLKLQGYIYVQYGDDPEQNGWFVPDQGQMADLDGASGLATGAWKLDNVVWMVAGHKRTNRESRNIWMKNLLTGLNPRDTLRWVYSTDFSSLATLQLSVIPSGATNLVTPVTQAVISGVTMPSGRDGGACVQVSGLADLQAVSYERPEASLNLSDVIVYDRRGNQGPFAPNPGYAATVLATAGLVSYWRLNETGGTTAADSADSNPGTYTGGFTLNQTALISGDPTAHSVSLNGSTGYITVPTAPNLNIVSAFTLEAWVNPTSTASTKFLCGRWSANNGYGLFIGATGGQVSLYINATQVISAGISAGVASHVVGTYDGTNARLYINGALAAGPTANGAPNSTALAFTIGQETSTAFLGGTVEEVAVYNGALPATTIANHYTLGASGSPDAYDTAAGLASPVSAYGWEEVYGPDYPWSWNAAPTAQLYDSVVSNCGPVDWWKLSETTGTTAADSKGSVTGTYQGGFTLGQPGIPGSPDTAVLFNGSTGAVALTGTPITATTNFGLECWVKLSSLSPQKAYFVICGSTAGNNGYSIGISDGTNASAGLVLTGVLFGVIAVNTGYTFSDTNWHHILMTRVASGGTPATTFWFVDGVQTSGTTNQTPNAPSNHASIGADVFDGSGFFAGTIAQVAAYNTALAATTAASHYSAGALTVLQDCPVIENGLVRVRYDPLGSPGIKVDAWNGFSYIEQGKMCFGRRSLVGNNFDSTWLSSTLIEYTPDRAVMSLVLNVGSADAFSSERVFVTVQRGQFGVTFENYPAPNSNGTVADASMIWDTVPGDWNDSALKSDTTTVPPTTGGAYTATASNISPGFFPSTASLGNTSFATSENYVALLRSVAAFNTVGPFQTNLAVVQAAAVECQTTDDSGTGYAQSVNALLFTTSGNAGYLSLDVAFAPTSPQQVMEAESFTLGSGTTSVGDGTSSGSVNTQASRTTDANPHITQANWPNSFLGTFRVWARVKTTAAQISLYAKTGATTGATKTSTSASYVWLDLGEITANNTTLEIHAWISSGSGLVEVDRIEAVLVQDRTRTAAIYSGARDLGSSVLYDARQLGAVVAR